MVFSCHCARNLAEEPAVCQPSQQHSLEWLSAYMTITLGKLEAA